MDSLDANRPIVEVSLRLPGTLRRALPFVILSILTALYLHPFIRVLTWTPDEGSYIYGAQLVTKGALPCRDFIEQYAPGCFYWMALWFKAFGTSFAAARGELWAVATALVLLVFYLTRRLGSTGVPGALYAVTTCVPAMVMNSQHYDSNLCALLALASFMWVESRCEKQGLLNPKLYFVPGLFAGVCACFIQQKGAYVAVALALSLLALHGKRSGRPLLALLLGSALPVLAEFAWFASQHAIADLIYANFVLPFATYSNLNRVEYAWPLRDFLKPGFWNRLDQHLPRVFAYALNTVLTFPFIVIAVTPLTLVPAWISKWQKCQRQYLPYWAVGYCIWLSEIHRLDLGHLRNACILLAPIMLSFLEAQRHWLPRAVFMAAMVTLTLNGVFAVRSAALSQTVLHSRRGDLLAEKPDPVLDYIQTHTSPGQDVFVYPYRPIYYFIAHVHNPTRFSALVYDRNMLPLFNEAVQNLETKNVRYVVVNDDLTGDNLKRVFPAYHPPKASEEVLEPYFRAHYTEAARFPGYRILERRN